MDSARARNTSLHGYPRETTPFLESFAEEATWYEQARAPGVHSIASHSSIFTGYHVHQHGMSEAESRLRAETTIWEELANDYGYDTALFSANYLLTHTSNLHEFFDHVVSYENDFERPFPDALAPEDINDVTPIRYLQACLRSDRTIESIYNGLRFKYDTVRYERGGYDEKRTDYPYVEAFLDWQADRSNWAACINMYTPHWPYTPDPVYDTWSDETLRDVYAGIDNTSPMIDTILSGDRPWWQLEAFEHLYDGALRQTDAIVEELISELKRRDAFEDTLIVVTSDHGEGFGERDLLRPDVRAVGHYYGVGEVLTHVPLIVKHPRQTQGRHVESPATLTEFPAVARSAVDGERGTFVPDGPVISSTFRVTDVDRLPAGCPNPTALEGPWYAVYRQKDGQLKKYATHKDESATIDVHDPSTAYRVDDTDRGIVDDVLGRLDEVDIKDGENTLSADAESRLHQLGYMT